MPDYSRTIPQWIKFSFADLKGSVRFKRMTLAQRGLYLTLLAEQATCSPIPADLDDLAVVVACAGINISEEDFLKTWDGLVKSCFDENDGQLANPRMVEAIDEYRGTKSALSKQRADAGAAGGKKSAEKRRSKSKQTEANPSKPEQSQAKEARQDKTRLEEIKQDTPTELTPLPPKGGSRAKPEPQVPLVDAAMAELGLSAPWLRELAVTWAELREDPRAKAKRVSAKTWKSNVKKLHGFGEPVARALVDEMVDRDWMAPVWTNAQQTSSQGPSRGGFYRGPALKDVEARTARRNIADRYRQMTGNILLEDEDAFEMARADDDWHMHDYDWKTGRRNDAPPDKPRSGTTIDFPPTPF